MKLNKAKLISNGLLLLLLALAFTSLYAFTISDLRFSVYIVLGAVFIAFVSILNGKIPDLNKSFPFLIFLYIIFSSLLNFESFKLTSVIYSFLFIIYYIYVNHYSKAYLKIESFIKFLKIVLIAYAVVLIIAQLTVFFDLQQITRPKGYFQGTGQFGIEYNYVTRTYRYFSLSTEPSYASIIVLLAFAALYNFTKTKKDIYLYAIITLYMLLSFKSAIGFIALFFFIASQIRLRNKHFLFMLIVVFIGTLLFFFTDLGGKSVERIRGIVFLIFTDFDNFLKSLNVLDSSAFSRIGPFIIYLDQVDLMSYQFYFGHGAATSDAYFVKIIYPEAWNTHMTFNPPFLPGFLYDYGLFGVLLVFFFLWRLVKDKSIFHKAILVLIVLNSNFNTQLFWFVMVILFFTDLYTSYQYPKIFDLPRLRNTIFPGNRVNP